MTDANHKQGSPVVAFVRKNAVVVGVSAALLIGVGTFAANALQPERTAAPAAVPTVNSTATLDGGPVSSPTPSPGSTAGPATAAPSASPGGAVGGQHGSGATDRAAGQPASTSPSPTAPRLIGAGPQAPELQDWKPIAEKFSAAWANPSVGKDAWLAAMKPYITPELLAQFSKTDIRNVPQDTLYNIRSVRHSDASWIFSPTFTSGKDRISAQITAQTGGSWLVEHVGAPE